MKKTILGLTVLLACSTLVAVQRDDDDPKKDTWMTKKLDYSKDVLGSLAMADFSKIAKHARKIDELSELEEWVHASNPDYQLQLKVFRAATKDLIDEADVSNIDGAALAFVQMSMSCVNCHKVVREKKK